MLGLTSGDLYSVGALSQGGDAMNRVGFLLLAVGVILAALGWLYDEPTYTGIGLLPLLVLYVLAAVFPDVIDYRHSRHAAVMPAVMNWMWRGVAVVGIVIAFIAVWHSSAAGWAGIPVVAAGAALSFSILVYTVLNDSRVAAWRQAKSEKRRRRSEEIGA
jgi:hypothetical protein